MKKYIILFTTLLLLVASTLHSQVIKKEVYVESTYRPEVADVDKISNMPFINDTIPFIKKTDYTVLPSHLKTEYELRPIKPASMVGTPLDKLYNSFIKLGIGNYVTPLAEFSIHNLRSKEYSVGAYFFHKSSHAKLTLDNGRKVPAGYGQNELAGHGKYFFKKATLAGNVAINTSKYRYYGINVFDTTIFPDTEPNLGLKELKQSFLHLYGGATITSNEPDTSAFYYMLGLNGGFYKDYFSNKEPFVNLNISLSQLVKSFRIGIDASLSNYILSDSSSSYKNNLVMVRPFIMKRGAEWEFSVAGKLFLESGERNRTYFFPDAYLRFDIVPKAIAMYVGVDGGVINNSYFKTTHENPYVLPGLYIKNTINQLTAFAGIEGKLSSKASYKFDVHMQAMKDAYFFLNDTLSELRNQFQIVYDDADLIHYHGEISWSPLTYLDLFTKLNYYSYKMVSEDKPWHKPVVDYSLSTRYNFKEKIFVEFELLALGKRYAKSNYVDTSMVVALDPVFDLNLKIEYKYSNVLSAFLHFYNLSSQEYYIWNQYPSQRINILLGITYKL